MKRTAALAQGNLCAIQWQMVLFIESVDGKDFKDRFPFAQPVYARPRGSGRPEGDGLFFFQWNALLTTVPAMGISVHMDFVTGQVSLVQC